MLLDQLGGKCRPVIPGGVCRGSPPDFGRSVNPRTATVTVPNYDHYITTGTPGFSDFPMALKCERL